MLRTCVPFFYELWFSVLFSLLVSHQNRCMLDFVLKTGQKVENVPHKHIHRKHCIRVLMLGQSPPAHHCLGIFSVLIQCAVLSHAQWDSASAVLECHKNHLNFPHNSESEPRVSCYTHCSCRGRLSHPFTTTLGAFNGTLLHSLRRWGIM